VRTAAIYVAWAISNVSVTDNYVTKLVRHQQVGRPGRHRWSGAEPDASTLTVSGNRLVNNRPSRHHQQGRHAARAEDNWWRGAADGTPAPSGSGTGDPVSANVATPRGWQRASPACPPVGTCGGGNPTPAPDVDLGKLKSIYH